LRVHFIVILLVSAFSGLSQIGGNSAYSFLNIPISARSSSLGGSSIGFKDNDINLVQDNPSNLDTTLHNNLSINYINYVSDINAGTFYYAHRIKKGALGVGIQFLGYGNFEKREANGDKTGEFKAGDYALNIGYGRSFKSVWSAGANIKLIYSNYYEYFSSAVALDLGGGYKGKKGLFTAGIVLKNLGTSLRKNQAGELESLPFEINMGISQRVPNSPFRFHLQYHHLQKWDLGSDDPNYQGGVKTNVKTGETSRKKFTVDNFMRHFILGTDLVFGENFFLTVAYNFRRRTELAFSQRKGLSGFSLGAGIKIKRLRFNYSYAQYTLSGGSSHIGISTNLSEYFTKK
tara:strand:- start:3558 stop:4595 length:1038 start_codon:yes stop_codon:yes gene_type:complete